MLAHTLEIRIDFGNVLVTVLAKCLSEALVKNAHQFSGRINSRADLLATPCYVSFGFLLQVLLPWTASRMMSLGA